MSDTVTLKDYRLINLIGCMYKILSKVLSIGIKKVFGKVISLEQSTYVEGSSIIDGPLIISELYSWAKKCKKKIHIFKVDFHIAFDSIN